MARKFTLPVMFTRRFRDGRTSSGLGSFVVINSDGWIVTADHIVADVGRFTESRQEIADYEARKQKIESDPAIGDRDKRRQIQRLPVSNEWITHQASMWGSQGWKITRFIRDPLADVAIGRIENFDPKEIENYPVFKNPTNDFKTCTSLCRLGFPFHKIKATFVESSGTFSLDPGTLPVPMFPNDGILTRFVMEGSADGSRRARFIETSSAGLRGQSGGPVFDKDALVYGIQSQTISLPLGFSPSVKQGNREIVEHQFMHLGWASDISNVINLLRANNVSFMIEHESGAAS